MKPTLKVMDLCVYTQHQKFGFCVLFIVLLLLDDVMRFGDGKEFAIDVILIL